MNPHAVIYEGDWRMLSEESIWRFLQEHSHEGKQPEETEVFLRGRNAKTATVPKNMETADYHMATGLEAVVGYLYLTGQDARLRGMMDTVISEGDL